MHEPLQPSEALPHTSGLPFPALAGWSTHMPHERRTPMQHEIWVRACYQVVHPNDVPVVIETRNGVGAFARVGQFIPTLHLVGCEELAEPIEVVASNPDGATEIADKLLEFGLPIRFGHHPAETAFCTAFAREAPKRGILLRNDVAGSPYIALDPGWTDPSQQFNSRRRSDFRRMQRRAEAIGAITYEFREPGPCDVATLLESAVSVEAQGWKSRSGTALADNSRQREFFEVYGKLASAQNILRINFIRIGGTIAAMQIAAECDGRYWLFKIGYDEQFARCSPGILLMLESIRRAAMRKLSTFEFLGKSAEWTRVWTETEHPSSSMRYYPRNARGVLALARDGVVVGSRRGRTRLQHLLERMRAVGT